MIWQAIALAVVLAFAGVVAAVWRRRRLDLSTRAAAPVVPADPDAVRQARRAHELQAIGLVAAGIAHDFNNTLTVVLGSASLLRLAAERHPELRHDGESLTTAARRAAVLTRRLLGLARRESPGIERVHAATLVLDLVPLLRRLLPSGATLEVEDATGGRDEVLCDPRALELALVGLIGGARPAVLRGGPLRLVCETATRSAESGAPTATVCVSIEGPAAMLDDDASRVWPLVMALPPEVSSPVPAAFDTAHLPDGRALVRLALPAAPDVAATEVRGQAH